MCVAVETGRGKPECRRGKNIENVQKNVPPVRKMEEESPENTDSLSASAEARGFLSSIESRDLQRCVFADSLVTLSDSGGELGEFTVTVQTSSHEHEPCFVVHANSHGFIDDIPCGTSITAYVSTTLEILEQTHHEYVKLQDHPLEKKCHMVRRGDEMVINKVIAEGEEVTTQTLTFPLSSLEGFVSEASNILIMRILAQRRTVPENMVFLSFDTDSRITTCTYDELGEQKQQVGSETVDVFGIQRTVESNVDVPATWHCYFLPDGHLASRVQIGSPVIMKLTQLPAELEEDEKEAKPAFEKKHLLWEEDMQMYSKFLDRKEELKASHASYVRHLPELKALLADFLQFLLLRKPEDIFSFAAEYFAPFSSQMDAGCSSVEMRKKEESQNLDALTQSQ
ncbi:ciliogenesis-associated TTC17-interacting protein [Arapaima gigas]